MYGCLSLKYFVPNLAYSVNFNVYSYNLHSYYFAQNKSNLANQIKTIYLGNQNETIYLILAIDFSGGNIKVKPSSKFLFKSSKCFVY